MRKIFMMAFTLLCAVGTTVAQKALPGRFTVNSDGDQVMFASGNLQFRASTGTWRFAQNQYDTIGADNRFVSSTYDGWIDLFGWGTSGWNGGAEAWQPWATSIYYSDYFPGGDYQNDLTGACANADWGVYNADQLGEGWRTLTGDEWYYILAQRKDAWSLNSQATVCGIHGYIFLSDGFVLPEGLSWEDQAADWTTDVYDAQEWQRMETNGALFLPAAGYREGTDVLVVNEGGDYVSSTCPDQYGIDLLFFNEKYSGMSHCCRHDARSVRLVHAADVLTSVETLQNPVADIRKIFRNGQMLILHNDRVYTLQGTHIK